MSDNTMQIKMAQHFPTLIYYTECPEYLDAVNSVSEESLNKVKKNNEINDIYPVHMSDNYFTDERIKDFCYFVGNVAWDILSNQGYMMEGKFLTFTEMWTQEHYKHSFMEQHVHGNSQIVGFYFLETPENCSRVLFHDPRPGKVQINMQEKDMSFATPASQIVNFEPKPGMLMFTNSWLPHSFTRHASDKPMKFVHFNLDISQNVNAQKNDNLSSEATVI